ncbi:MAG: type III pantothenate kinase [Bacteroidota bacterium]
MIVAVDIGNSNVVLGCHDGEDWAHFWRLQTVTTQDAAVYYDIEIRNLILESRLDLSQITGVILSAVVPQIRELMAEILTAAFEQPVVVVGPELYNTLNYKVPRPYEIGTDLVANAYSAYRRQSRACVVVDFGTALTFTTLDDTGYVAGVAIAPGIKTAMKALSSNTAQLPEIPLELPDSVLGLHTTHAIQAGILWGYVGIVKELLEKIRSEVDHHIPAIATGGLSFVMSEIEGLFVEIDPQLTLDGLRFMLEDL